jgi:Leucine-rich repeat (LRR) protein
MRYLIVYLFAFLAINSFAQGLSQAEVDNFKTEGKELISYLEFTLNSIGDNELTAKEKDIIISESFRKMFRDEKVQIEDDLDDSRETVTNKDVQAYLKDVDFFFQTASFKFNILSIDVQLNENGKPFLMTNILRSLQAVDIKGRNIKNDQQRFVEIELDSDKRELKIASIYTTKINEYEENMRWWNFLPSVWKEILGKGVEIKDGIHFNKVKYLNSNYFVVESRNKPIPVLQSGQNAKVHNFAFDTIKFKPGNSDNLKDQVFKALQRILDINDLNIAGNNQIIDLEPLSNLSNLRTLNVSSTLIQDIFPVRNLTKLHNLNCSNTAVSSLEPLIYSMELSILNVSNTEIYDIEPLRNLSNLKILDISNTEIDNLNACTDLLQLEDLKLRNTQVIDLSPLNQLKNLSFLDLSDNERFRSVYTLQQLSHLKILYLNNTSVKDLSSLISMSNLEVIYCENSEISSLDGLQYLPKLKKIYCDNSLLGKQKAIDFMKSFPHILVVYESKQLQMWWSDLSEAWKQVFSKLVALDVNPTKEQLHEVTALKEIDISNNAQIKSLLPLDKLKNLQKLNASFTSISNLDGIAEAREIKALDISNTMVSRLYVLEGMNLIEELKLSNCPVQDLSPLRGFVNLKRLYINTTLVDNLSELTKLPNLRYLNADFSKISHAQAESFTEDKNDRLIIYQSEELLNWWEFLSDGWKSIFSNLMKWNTAPDSEELHKLIQIQSIEIKENRQINDLLPLEKLVHLRKVKINDTRISAISSLSGLKFLQEVDLSRNPISDLSPIAKLATLEFVYLNNTPIDNLDWISGLQNLKVLDISGTEIKNLKEVSSANRLQKLIAYNTKINNIKALEELAELVLIKIYNSKISPKKIEAFKQKRPACEIDYY